ncbi:MAG: acetylxylan esterase [Odoribacter sp.]|nr:acetylxylan esterase [Odoribacter sp.]
MKRLSLIVFLFLGFLAFAENNPYRSDVYFAVTPDHADWIYKTGEKAKIKATVYKYGIPQDGMEIQYETGLEMLKADDKGTVRTKNGTAEITVGTLKQPGYRQCVMTAQIDGKEYKHHIKLAFSPEKIQPTVKMPADFLEFWEKSKAEAAKVPQEIHINYVPELSTLKVEVYEVKLQCYKKGSYVYGYLSKPRKEGKFPVIFNPPGAGIKPMEPNLYYAENDLICFNMEIHGIRPSLSKEIYGEISSAFRDNNNYMFSGIDNRDNYYYKKVYLACVRALDYLTSLAEYDGKNLIALGGSQGGALAIVTAALDNRVKYVVANHPALSDMTGYLYGRAGGWPHVFTRYNDMNKPDKIETLSYYDVVNFAKHVKVPGFYTWGYNDNTCPPTSVQAVYNSIDAPKEALITPMNEHWVSWDTRMEQIRWIKEQIKKDNSN